MNIIEILLLICLLGAPSILLALWLCCELLDTYKNEDGYNRHNSSSRVQCNAKDKCDWRHSSMCASCRHNCGAKKEKTSYIPK